MVKLGAVDIVKSHCLLGISNHHAPCFLGSWDLNRNIGNMGPVNY